MTLKVGEEAPQFILYNTKEEQVSLVQLKGRTVLLLFFPFAFTGVCTQELCGIRDSRVFYENKNAEVLGISVDSAFTLKRFKEDLNLNFQLLCDFNKEVANAYECIYETFALGTRGVAKRSAFVIDKGGIIRYAEILENAGEVPNFPAIQNCINALS